MSQICSCLYVIDYLDNDTLFFEIQLVAHDILFKLTLHRKEDFPRLSLQEMYQDGLLTDEPEIYGFELFYQIMGCMITRRTFEFDLGMETLAVTFDHPNLPCGVKIRIDTITPSYITKLLWPTDWKIAHIQPAPPRFLQTRREVLNSLSKDSVSEQYSSLSDVPGISTGTDQIWYLKSSILIKCPLLTEGISDFEVKTVVDEFGNGFPLSETHNLLGNCDASDLNNIKHALNQWTNTDKQKLLLFDANASHTSMGTGDIVKTESNQIWFVNGNHWYKIKSKKKCAVCSSHILFSKCKICKGCKNIRYCSRKCQKIDWKKTHRLKCQ